MTVGGLPVSRYWELSNRADPEAVRIADRHYSRQKPGTPQFVPPGRCLVLKRADALWVTSWPYAAYVKHRWAGAFMCSIFRNEGRELSSTLISEALGITLWKWPSVPELGMVTFVDRSKVKSKKHPGYCFLCAGFENVGKTKGGLVALQLLPDRFPDPILPFGVLL